ncbi:MAG: ChrR family anti-sigma-E factor [Candidatus Pelagadaptatus aseana]|uniref:ChrR family anti-sigma-E factor n=1 Tax=Candidatus Pelagadaptatus aseana TaxID=3120508 RepID=UPI0039B18EE1
MSSHYPGHHPSSDMLRSYCAGELDDVVSIMVAAHINFCPECQKQAARIDDELAANALEYSSVEPSKPLDLAAMLEKATASEQTAPPSPRDKILNTAPSDQIKVSIRDRQIAVPPVLSGIVERSGPWNHVVNELWQSPVKGHGHGYQVDFIYMYPGGTVPSHTHNGREITLVLDGSFSDSEGEYAAGDFLIKTSQDEHNPISERGCLCLAAIDAPLHFTSGISRLVNPFSQLFFRSEA